MRAAWLGTLGSSELRVRLILVRRADYFIDEPSQVIDMIGSDLADASSGGDPAFRFDTITNLTGRFGEADAQLVRDALTHCVVYDGPQLDPKWTDAAALARWKQDAPDSLTEAVPELLRSAHSIVLTDSSGGQTFSKQREEYHAAIRKVYPFDEAPGRRLMPVFLFRTNDQYHDFFAKAFGSTAEAVKRSGGVASGDFFAAWYEAPGDPVHIHEGTHQVFANRLGLRGGGSRIQEGVDLAGLEAQFVDYCKKQ